MTTRVTLQSLADGRVVVDKQSLTAEHGNPTREAHWLAMARDPGVVQLVSVSEEPFTIRTAHAGTTTLRTARPEPHSAARLLSATAETLANLHERNLAHGKLTMDHIIVSGENRTTLCSPDGVANDPTADLVSLGEIVTDLLESWDSAGQTVPNQTEWRALAERLTNPASSYTARRAQMAFSRLDAKTSATPTRSNPRLPRPTLKLLAGLGATVAIVGTLISWLATAELSEARSPDSSGTELLVGTDLYQVGDLSYVAVAVPTPCAGQPLAVLLDSNSVVWIFDTVGDGAQASSLAQVRGATDLRAESADGCGQVWATGPAGQSLVVGS